MSHTDLGTDSPSRGLVYVATPVVIIGKIAVPITAVAMSVCIVALLILAGNGINTLLYVGGGLKPGIVLALLSTAKWSGIVSAAGLALVIAGGIAYRYLNEIKKTEQINIQTNSRI